MIALFLSAGYAPFTLSLALLFGLLLLELTLSLLGGSLMGLGGDTADLDGPDFDAPDFDAPDFDTDLDTPDLDTPEMATDSGFAGWLGFGRMPAAIWLASVLAGFGLIGLTLQSLTAGVLGTPLPAGLVALPSGLAALWVTRRFGALFARLLPKTETQALSERHLGRRVGVVSQGTAARGRPAEVRVSDRYGNTHYLRAEPLRDGVEIPKGAEVVVLRDRYSGGYRLVPLTD